MKLLVVQGHPDADSFVAALASQYTQVAIDAGHDVDFFDLARERFDPVLRFGYRSRMEPDEFIDRSQEALLRCDHLTLLFPTWWAAEPSVLKGWFDRVFTPGVAYTYRPGKATPTRLLRGKSATLITTSHAPAFYARTSGAYPLRRIDQHVLGYCGIQTTGKLVLGSMDGPKDTPIRREAFISEVRHAAQTLSPSRQRRV